MTITNYVSIKTVLYDISTMISDRYWSEQRILEWITKGYRKLSLEAKLSPKSTSIQITDNKGKLPSDLKYLTQIVKDNLVPLRLSTASYGNSVCTLIKQANCTTCPDEFAVSTNLVITTTLSSGCLTVFYLGYDFDEDGYQLIPDDERVKEALMHYALYNYWQSKFNMKEEGAEQRMKFYLNMWQTSSLRATALNNPDVSQLENLKNQSTRLYQSSNRFDTLFQDLNSPNALNIQ